MLVQLIIEISSMLCKSSSDFTSRLVTFAMGIGLAASAPASTSNAPSKPVAELEAQRKEFLGILEKNYSLDKSKIAEIDKIIHGSPVMGQGNPAVTKHPVAKTECEKRLPADRYQHPEFKKICGAAHMAPLYNPAKEKITDAKACIDQFEFPNVPCEYPLVWTRADEAAALCDAVGKRLCDAHEWEGACNGELLDPDYEFAMAKGKSLNNGVETMRASHNRKYAASKRWAYGNAEYTKGVCAANSTKDSKCNGGDWKNCGSNTYPAGMFPRCKSPLGVYDQHGNAAEHMNLPLDASQMASKGSKALGVTEMKGSWFIFDKFQAHQDWCRWRAPFWHGTKLRDVKSHHNYHLGFRCCKSL